MPHLPNFDCVNVFINDNFQGRGSDNPNTGPIRDHSSFASNTVTGAFAYIDAAAPRRPNDVAQVCLFRYSGGGGGEKYISE